MGANSKVECMHTFNPVDHGRLIPGYECYCVTPDGRVWTRFRANGKNPRAIGSEWREKVHDVTKKGHHRVELHELGKGGKVRKFMVHVLVLEAFVGPRPEGLQCCHNDGNPSNNAVTNLRWDTAKGNWADRKRHGRGCEGEKSTQAKLTAKAVLDIRESRKRGVKLRELAEKYGVSIAKVSQVARGLNWSHV